MLLAALGVSNCPFCMLVRKWLAAGVVSPDAARLAAVSFGLHGGATFDPGSCCRVRRQAGASRNRSPPYSRALGTVVNLAELFS